MNSWIYPLPHQVKSQGSALSGMCWLSTMSVPQTTIWYPPQATPVVVDEIVLSDDDLIVLNSSFKYIRGILFEKLSNLDIEIENNHGILICGIPIVRHEGLSVIGIEYKNDGTTNDVQLTMSDDISSRKQLSLVIAAYFKNKSRESSASSKSRYKPIKKHQGRLALIKGAVPFGA